MEVRRLGRQELHREWDLRQEVNEEYDLRQEVNEEDDLRQELHQEGEPREAVGPNLFIYPARQSPGPGCCGGGKCNLQ